MGFETIQADGRVTIKDVSRAAGVSIATVSNAINTPDVLAPDTLKRVVATIEQLGYRPNRNAVALQKQKTSSIGYRMPNETSGFALDIFLHRIVERASTSGIDVVLFTPHPGQTEVEAYNDMVRRGAVDGFILSGTDHSDERVSYLLKIGFPFATFGRTDRPGEHSWVDVDGHEGVRLAVEHLVSLGHEHIALLRWPEGSITGDERFDGFIHGLDQAALAGDPDLIVTVENNVADAASAVGEMLAGPTPPTAIVCVQDTLALGAMKAIADAGLNVGRDIAVTGFDDTPIAAHTNPGLTSVRQMLAQVGDSVVDMLLAALVSGSEEPTSVMVRPELVVRSSTAQSGSDQS